MLFPDLFIQACWRHKPENQILFIRTTPIYRTLLFPYVEQALIMSKEIREHFNTQVQPCIHENAFNR